MNRRAALSWALYDLAYAMWAFLVIARVVAPLVTDTLGKPDWTVSVTQVGVAGIELFAMPWIGMVADRYGRHKPFVLGFTGLAVLATLAMGLVPIGDYSHTVAAVIELVLVGVAAAGAQMAFSQYEPLLAAVSPPRDRGRTSSLAVLGNFGGAFIALGASSLVLLSVSGHGDIPVARRSLVAAALLYVLFTLPFTLFVRDRPHGEVATDHGVAGADVVGFLPIVRTIRRLVAVPNVGRFMLAKLLYSDAMAAISTFSVVYINRVGDFSGQQVNAILVATFVAAGVAAIVSGNVVQLVGPKQVLLWILPTFAVCIWIAAVFGAPWTVWVLGPALGAAQASVWTVERVLLLHLTPEQYRGEFFGVANLFSRASGSVLPLVFWSGLIFLLHDHTHWLSALDASRVSLATLAASAFVGFLVLRPLRDGWSRPGQENRPADGNPA